MSGNLNAEILARVEMRAAEIGLSARQVSLMSGHGPDLIRDWKRPKASLPRLDSIQKLAEVLQVPAGWLAYGESAGTTENFPKPGEEKAYRLFLEAKKLSPEDLDKAMRIISVLRDSSVG